MRSVQQRNGSTDGARSRRARGITLMELLIVVAIVSMIGVAIAMMVKGTADGTNGQLDGRRHLARAQALEAVVLNTVRPAREVLNLTSSSGTTSLVLWNGDGPTYADSYVSPNLSVNLSELVLIENNPTTKQLLMWRVPTSTWSSSSMASYDSTYAANANFYSAVQTAKSGTLFKSTVIANNVSAFTVTLDNATTTKATMATLWITLDDGTVQRDVVIPAGLRVTQAPQ